MHASYHCIGAMLATAVSAAAVGGGPDPPLFRQAQLQSASFDHPPLCRRFPYHVAPARARTLNHLQHVVRDMARTLSRPSDPIERGAIIYLRPDGSLRMGEISDGDHDGVDLTASPAPDEVIIAAAHTHALARYYAADQRRLSPEDIALGKRLLAHPRASPHLLLYVIDLASSTISEYPAAGRCPHAATA